MSDQVPPEKPAPSGVPGEQDVTAQPGTADGQPQESGADQPTMQHPAAKPGAEQQPAAQDAAFQQPGAPQVGTQQASGMPGPDTPPQPPYGQQPPPGRWGAPQLPRQRGGFRRFAGNRVTQLVAVGVLGLLVGGGIVGGVMAATQHDTRPGISRFRDGGGEGHRTFPGGRGFHQGGTGGNSGDTGSPTGTGTGSGI